MGHGVDIGEKVASPTCGTCSVTLVRPFVCLHCSYSGCWTKSHIRSHLRHTGHLFCEFWIRPYLDANCPLTVVPGADPKTGRIFCSECDNFILNTAFEALFSVALLKAEEAETKFQGMNNQTVPFSRRLKHGSHEKGPRSLPPLDARRKGCHRAQGLCGDPMRSPPRSAEPRPNVFLKRHPPILHPQSAPPQLLPERQAQPRNVQKY